MTKNTVQTTPAEIIKHAKLEVAAKILNTVRDVVNKLNPATLTVDDLYVVDKITNDGRFALRGFDGALASLSDGQR